MRNRRLRPSALARALLLVGLATALLVACVVVLPPLLVPLRVGQAEGLPPQERLRFENDRIGLQNQARATLLQAFAGAFFLVTAFLTWRQIQVNREGQITERFTRAIEHLGTDDKLDVRLGGIYALGRIADDSQREHGAIVEILTAYIRGHAASAGPGAELTGLAPHLDGRPVWQTASAQLVAIAHQDADVVLDPPGELGDQLRLADPASPPMEDGLGRPGDHRGEGRLEERELGLPAGEARF